MRKKLGFSILEVLVALGILTLGILLVGALAQQIMQLANRAKQTGLSIDFKTIALQLKGKDTGPWLDKMRGRFGVYDGCLPAVGTNTANYTCPTPVAELSDLANGAVNESALRNSLSDPAFVELASGFHWANAPMIEPSGDDLAGSAAQPRYLTLSGAKCELANPEVSCPIQVISFFGRTNADVHSPPGYIRFIVMLGKNPGYNPTGQASIPMATQFLKFDVGTRGDETAAGCANSDAIWLGYLPNGTAYCVNPTQGCGLDANGIKKIPIGVDGTGAPICESLPICQNEKVPVLNSSNHLVCEQSTVCAEGYAHIGYYSGSGTPICLSPTSCSDNYVQIGFKTEGQSVVPSCKQLPTPSCDSQNLAVFDGDKFQCQTTILAQAKTCPNPNDVVTGINPDKSLICRDIASMAGLNGLDGTTGVTGQTGVTGATGATGANGTTNTIPIPTCKAGQVITSNGSGGFRCVPNTAKTTTEECDDDKEFRGIKADGTLICRNRTKPAVDYDHCQVTNTNNMSTTAAKTALGITIDPGYSAEHWCPKDMVMIGVNNKSVDNALCCKMK